jgi:elongator complex protein 2
MTQHWAEVSRAQVHGYDINCGCFLDGWHFISGADEKMLRVFAIPSAMEAFHLETMMEEEPTRNMSTRNCIRRGFGFMPELSLTNKPQQQQQQQEQQQQQQQQHIIIIIIIISRL